MEAKTLNSRLYFRVMISLAQCSHVADAKGVTAMAKLECEHRFIQNKLLTLAESGFVAAMSRLWSPLVMALVNCDKFALHYKEPNVHCTDKFTEKKEQYPDKKFSIYHR